MIFYQFIDITNGIGDDYFQAEYNDYPQNGFKCFPPAFCTTCKTQKNPGFKLLPP